MSESDTIMSSAQAEARELINCAQTEARKLINVAQAQADKLVCSAKDMVSVAQQQTEHDRSILEQERIAQAFQLKLERQDAQDFLAQQDVLVKKAQQTVADLNTEVQCREQKEHKRFLTQEKDVSNKLSIVDDMRDTLTCDTVALQAERKHLEQWTIIHEAAVQTHKHKIDADTAALDQRANELTAHEAYLAKTEVEQQDIAHAFHKKQSGFDALNATLQTLEKRLYEKEQSLGPHMMDIHKREEDLKYNWSIYAAHKRAFDAANSRAAQRGLRGQPLGNVPSDMVENDGPD